MRTRSTLFIALCFGLSLAAPRSGVAQPKGPLAHAEIESDPVIDQARELDAKGAQLYAKGEWAKAHAAFRASFCLRPHWSTAGNLGACEMKLGMYRDAAEHFAFSLRQQPVDNDPVARRAADLLRQARAHVGRVTIQVNIDGAEIAIDRRPIGKAPLTDEVFVDVGERVIEATRAGYKDARQAVRAEPGSSQAVSLMLVPLEMPAAKRPPVVSEPRPNPVPWLIGGAAVAAVGLSVGVGLTAAANGKSTDADALYRRYGDRSYCFGKEAGPLCVEIRETLESQDAFADGAKVSFMLGGVAALGTVIVHVLWSGAKPNAKAEGTPERRSTTRMSALPWVSAEDARVQIVGTF